MKEKNTKGTLEEVSGAGAAIGSVWHLMIDKFYYGQLLFTGDKFVFHAQLDKYKWMEGFGEYFGEIVTLWYE